MRWMWMWMWILVVGCVDPVTSEYSDQTTSPPQTETTDIVDTGPIFPPVGGTATQGGQQCVQFTGDADRIRADDDFLPRESDARTLQAWARTHNRADQVVVGYGRPASRLGWIIGMDGGHPYLSSGTSRLTADDVDVADGAWHHYTATWNGIDKAVLYVDGDQVATGVLEVTTLDGDFVVGNSPTGDHKPFVGIVDDVRVFDRARLPQEFPGDLDGDLYADDWLAMWWDFEGIDGVGFGTEVEDRARTGILGSAGGDDDSPTFPSCR